MLTSEFVVLENPLGDEEDVAGVHLLNAHLFIHGTANCCRYDMRGNLETRLVTDVLKYNFFIRLLTFFQTSYFQPLYNKLKEDC